MAAEQKMSEEQKERIKEIAKAKLRTKGYSELEVEGSDIALNQLFDAGFFAVGTVPILGDAADTLMLEVVQGTEAERQVVSKLHDLYQNSPGFKQAADLYLETSSSVNAIPDPETVVAQLAKTGSLLEVVKQWMSGIASKVLRTFTEPSFPGEQGGILQGGLIRSQNLLQRVGGGRKTRRMRRTGKTLPNSLRRSRIDQPRRTMFRQERLARNRVRPPKMSKRKK